MPLDLEKEQTQLDELRAFWQPILRLSDWQITARIDPALAPNLGMCVADHVYRRAEIRIAPSTTPGQDLEASLVHELIHPHFAAFETASGTDERNEEERAVESLMRGCLDLKRKGVSTGALRQLARKAFDACHRKRPLSQRGRGQERHRMPNSSVLAALAIKAGQLMAQEGMPEEAKSLFEEFLKAMAGGDEPPQSQNEPHAAPQRDGEGDANTAPSEPGKPPMRAGVNDGEIAARLRRLETHLEIEAKARKSSEEKRRTALLGEAKARIPEGQQAFAASLSAEQLEAYVATLPARAPVDRSQRALRGGDQRTGDPENQKRLRAAMGIVSTDVELPHRDDAGRKTYPVNGPSALRRALLQEGDK